MGAKNTIKLTIIAIRIKNCSTHEKKSQQIFPLFTVDFDEAFPFHEFRFMMGDVISCMIFISFIFLLFLLFKF